VAFVEVEPGVRLFSEFADSGHSPQWEEPERFAAVLDEFLARVQSGAGSKPSDRLVDSDAAGR
jgi:hypothetical protein